MLHDVLLERVQYVRTADGVLRPDHLQWVFGENVYPLPLYVELRANHMYLPVLS
jgi:hypothetical protein